MSDPQQLITAYLDDALTEAERDELAVWLKARPDHLREFVEANLFEQQLRAAVASQAQREALGEFGEAGGALDPREALRIAANGLPWFRRLWPRLAAAGASALVLIVAGWALWMKPPSALEGTELAWITRTRSAQVPASAQMPHLGQKLGAGRLTLVAGAVEITLRNGVTMVFEGPGEIELLTPMRAILHTGQAVARVPKNARGFRLETPGANVVDLGTEFAVKCGPGGATDVLVFDGAVMAAATAGSAGFPHQLTAGTAARFSPDQPQPTKIAFRPERFVRRLPPDQGLEIADHGFPFNRPIVEEAAVFPLEQPIAVDGDLSDWSGEGLFQGERGVGRFLEGRMRYDAEFLYVAAHIGDPAPMRSVVDPATDGESGWRGGGLQIRVAADPALGWPVNANAAPYYQMRELPVDAAQIAQATNPALAHLTLWHFAPAAQNCLHIAYGMDLHGAVANPPGYRAAFRQDADGRGYTLEYAIPWKLLNAPRAPRPGDVMAMSWTVHWSDEGGRVWQRQWVEIGNPAEPLRIFTWERAATWGRAVFH